MTRHRLEVADVFRNNESEFRAQFWSSLSTDQRRAFRAIIACRTKELGGHIERCNLCGRERNAYNSCRNRHCPKCQAMAGAKWVDARSAELLPIPYFHVIFTLPRELGPIALQNPRAVYGILLQAAAETLKQLAADPKHLGAEIGVLEVLHTWGQSLVHHPHCHCIVTGGGISPDGKEWIPCKRNKKSKKEFFVPYKVLSRKFRGKFIAYLKQAYSDGELSFHGRLANLKSRPAFEGYLNSAVRKDWVVQLQRPFANPMKVLKYLARYTHRVAISNNRLVDMSDGIVRFQWKDYADGSKQKVMAIQATEFIRRFLLHVVPSGFVRIRHYGFLANRNRTEKLELCRRLLGVVPVGSDVGQQSPPNAMEEERDAAKQCPYCRTGELVTVDVILKEPRLGTGAVYPMLVVPKWPP